MGGANTLHTRHTDLERGRRESAVLSTVVQLDLLSLPSKSPPTPHADSGLYAASSGAATDGENVARESAATSRVSGDVGRESPPECGILGFTYSLLINISGSRGLASETWSDNICNLASLSSSARLISLSIWSNSISRQAMVGSIVAETRELRLRDTMLCFLTIS